jgi:hypothetical protein
LSPESGEKKNVGTYLDKYIVAQSVLKKYIHIFSTKQASKKYRILAKKMFNVMGDICGTDLFRPARA